MGSISKRPFRFFRGAIPVIAVLGLFSSDGSAKSMYRGYESAISATTHHLSTSDITALEERLTTVLENRIIRRQRRFSPLLPPQVNRSIEIDLRTLPRAWSRLSAQFKTLYKRAASVPDDFSRFESPGGHFEIYYTTSGPDSVDVTDRYGYRSNDWKTRSEQPNGIPDYIDEAAFALDSCWSMMIERFGFPPPYPYRDAARPSDRYKVVVEAQFDGYYGLTYIHDKAGGERGYASLLSVRNDWSGGEWRSLGYDKRPVDGIRVTCAHEFFHAIQYAMSWDVQMDVFLDDFPLSWTEGTAVAMEEFAFDSINDYHQYAYTYFNNPGIPFFSRGTTDIVYTNALLPIYLFYHFSPVNDIDFIRTMYLANYSARIPFHRNLFATASKHGSSWTELLHRFHTASFLTGSRADAVRFIPDAHHFTMRQGTAWAIADTLRRTMALNSAAHIRFVPASHHGDTLAIRFSGDTSVTQGSQGTNWACSFVTRRNGTETWVPMTIAANGTSSARITHWRELSDIVVVITNADPVQQRKATLVLDLDSIVSYESITLFPNPVSLSGKERAVRIRGDGIQEITIHTLSGALVWRYKEETDAPPTLRRKSELRWNTNNSNSAAVVPGTYIASIVRSPLPSSTIKRYSRHKMLVQP